MLEPGGEFWYDNHINETPLVMFIWGIIGTYPVSRYDEGGV